jgi:hypothetical protein
MIDGVTTTASGIYAIAPIGREDLVIAVSIFFFLVTFYMVVKIINMSS